VLLYRVDGRALAYRESVRRFGKHGDSVNLGGEIVKKEVAGRECSLNVPDIRASCRPARRGLGDEQE
jgi:hypothetical protein